MTGRRTERETAGVIEVRRAGPRTTVQDLGRPGWAHLGVPRSGALDPAALALANRLVGNPADTAGLELTLGGCELRLTRAGTVAVTGADVDVRVDRRPGDVGRPLAVPAGAVLRIGPPRHGLRNWLAVDGGIAVAPVLGSRSTDTLSGLGPPRSATATGSRSARRPGRPHRWTSPSADRCRKNCGWPCAPARALTGSPPRRWNCCSARRTR